MRATRGAGLADIVVPVHADARELSHPDASHPDATFDAAYLCATLGEVPDVDAALAELRRVLRPGGRLVVGETFFEPIFVRARDLQARAERVGLRHERRGGGVAGYFARFSA